MLQKKVLILIQYLSPGGIEWMVAHLAKGLNANSIWQPVVCVYDHNGVEPIDTFFTKQNIPFIRLQKAIGFPVKIIMKLFHVIRKENISVVHVHHLGALIIAVFLKTFRLGRLKIVYTQHSFIHLAKYPRYRLLEKIFSAFADEITVVSEQVLAEFKTYNISQRQIQLIPNGSAFPKLPQAEIKMIEQQRANLIAQESVPNEILPQDFWLLYLGRIHPGKGQDHALKLWEALPSELRKKSRLLFIGPASDQSYVELIKSQIKKSLDANRIHILKSTLQASQWMQVSNVFLSSSESEGWPMAVLEALGAGTVTLLSNIPGHQMYNRWAQFYDLNTPIVGAQKLQAMLEAQDTPENFTTFRKNQWRQTADLRQQFSIEKMVSNFENVYGKKTPT